MENKPVRMIQIDRHDGKGKVDYPLADYIREHPEDFYPVVNGRIVGTIPFSPQIFGQPNEDGNIIIPAGQQVAIEEVETTDTGIVTDVVVTPLTLCNDGYGNEWWEKK